MTENPHCANATSLTTDTRDAHRGGTRRSLLAALLGVACSGVPSFTAASARTATAAPAVGSKLALVDVPLIEGGQFRAAEAEGRVVVVYWWASWCPFCAEMSPSIERLWRNQRDRGLTVLGISIDKTIDAAREYRRRRNFTFPSAMHSPEIEGALPKPRMIPVLWVRDRAGRIAMVESGQMFPEDVEQIARLL